MLLPCARTLQQREPVLQSVGGMWVQGGCVMGLLYLNSAGSAMCTWGQLGALGSGDHLQCLIMVLTRRTAPLRGRARLAAVCVF